MGWVLVCVMGASVMCGVVWHGRAFIVTGTLLLIAAVGVLLPYLSIQKLLAKITPLQYRGQVGQEMPVRIQVENQNWWTWGTTVLRLSERPSGSSPEGYQHEHMVPRIERKGTTNDVVSLVPSARGLFPDQTGTLVTRFPFGLFTATKTFPIPNQAIIWPEIVPLAGRVSDSRYSGYESSATSARHWGDEGDIAGPRPYRPGESLRRVHWRHTARRGDLIVCERESTSSRRLRIRLDLEKQNSDDIEAAEAYEAAISIAASLISQAVGDNWHVDFELSGHRSWEGIDQNGLLPVFDYLAMLDTENHPREVEYPSTTRRDTMRSVLVTQRPLGESYPDSWHDEILCTSPIEPAPGQGARCVWLPPHSDWRNTIQQTGSVLYG
ncbi:hypothetical protein Pan97_17670 [Bremerella volcania]|uniref:DUF58 domain-containing protein n=2 Tax=Bremerella volcania TaxID=2527984 RepID=A0A518C6B7_9BACT|nr:hypothetical protein Pan97_17670 [Bremerella volcania]